MSILYVDSAQFGSTAGRSTTLALIKMCHILFKASDDCHNFIRVLFIDFSKAFERIDHNVLGGKLVGYKFPPFLSA